MKKCPKTMFFDSPEFLTKVQELMELDLGSVQGPYHDYTRRYYGKNISKKYTTPSSTDERTNKAIAKFLLVNDRMGALNDSFDKEWAASSSIMRDAKSIISYILGQPPLMEEVFSHCKNSTGASIGVSFWDTSPERKFRYPISVVGESGHLWWEYLSWDEDLAAAIYFLNGEGSVSDPLVFVDGSRATTVPKTDDIDRLIAVEPVVNMFFQHGLKSCIERRLMKAGLSFDRDPERHRHLAYLGSITNRIATVDFSSASDSLALEVVRFLIPEGWMSWLETVRSPMMNLQGSLTRLNMISTMGNATTFPIETLVLYALACAVCSRTLEPSRLPKLDCLHLLGVSVFGDDCILPANACDLFSYMANRIGFEVNLSKSFWGEDYFRESCGGDFYHGRDVRPFYLKSLPRGSTRIAQESFLYTTINGILRKYIQYFGPLAYVYDKHLLRFLFTLLNSVTDKVKFVPEDFPEDSGLCHIRDMGRFRRSYYLKLSPVMADRSGMIRFTFNRFVFTEKSSVDGRLRYSLLLKQLEYVRINPLVSGLPDIRGRNFDAEKYSLRRRGRYVESVSKFATSCRLPNNTFARSMMSS